MRTVRGYGTRFPTPGSGALCDHAWIDDDHYEHIDPKAFDGTLTSSAVTLLLDGHASDQVPIARTGDGTLRLWCDAFGLAFEADLPSRDEWSMCRTIARERSFCSVKIDVLDVKHCTRNGKPDQRIMRAKLLHIACTSKPAYLGCGVWLASSADLKALPSRLYSLNAMWEEGRANYRAPSATPAPSRPPARRVPNVAAVLATIYPNMPDGARHIMAVNRAFGSDPRKWPLTK